jgi:hypothetical protein
MGWQLLASRPRPPHARPRRSLVTVGGCQLPHPVLTVGSPPLDRLVHPSYPQGPMCAVGPETS